MCTFCIKLCTFVDVAYASSSVARFSAQRVAAYTL
nr:MAG TPA: hypothetical protein [Microviridae sp.]